MWQIVAYRRVCRGWQFFSGFTACRSSRPTHPGPSASDSGSLRVPPSIAEADGPVNPILGHIRLPYELAYGEPRALSRVPIPIEEPDRSLAVAQITEVIKKIYYYGCLIVLLTLL